MIERNDEHDQDGERNREQNEHDMKMKTAKRNSDHDEHDTNMKTAITYEKLKRMSKKLYPIASVDYGFQFTS